MSLLMAQSVMTLFSSSCFQHFSSAISDKEIQWDAFSKEHICKTILANYMAQYRIDCGCLFDAMFYHEFKKRN